MVGARYGAGVTEVPRRPQPSEDTQPSEEAVQHWAVLAAQAASAKQGRGVVVLRVGGVMPLVEWFVICDGANARQVRTIVDEVERVVSAGGGPKPLRVEGLEGRHWVLMDYGDVVVHVFDEESRSYYDLERLWADVPRLEWEPAPTGDRPAGTAVG